MALPEQQRRGVLGLSVMAAMADGGKSDAEREQIRVVAEGLSAEAADLPRVVQDVLLKRLTVQDAAGLLDDPAERTLAFEMAVVVCDADGQTTDAERRFLDEVRVALSLDDASCSRVIKQADAIAEAPLDSPDAVATALAPVATAPASVDPLAADDIPPGVPVNDPPTEPAAADAAETDQQADSMILKYAILNGALELLPQNLATLAILPLQTKMVYRIGRLYGHSLDRRSIGEFIAALGMGATSQMLENVARKFIGRFGKSIAGGLGKDIARTATGAAFSFASTYAIGELAKRYYRSGRSISLADLKAQSGELVERGKSMFDQYRPQVEQQAQTVDTGQILNLVRGK